MKGCWHCSSVTALICLGQGLGPTLGTNQLINWYVAKSSSTRLLSQYLSCWKGWGFEVVLGHIINSRTAQLHEISSLKSEKENLCKLALILASCHRISSGTSSSWLLLNLHSSFAETYTIGHPPPHFRVISSGNFSLCHCFAKCYPTSLLPKSGFPQFPFAFSVSMETSSGPTQWWRLYLALVSQFQLTSDHLHLGDSWSLQMSDAQKRGRGLSFRMCTSSTTYPKQTGILPFSWSTKI